MNKHTLYYITGPIGAGKSSSANLLISEFASTDVEYISADLYYSLYFMNCIGGEQENYEKAKKYRDYKINKAMENKQTFIWESVFVDKKVLFLQHCKKQGYSLVGLFVGTYNVDILIERVKKRMLEGWYDVPTEKIIDRYNSMMGALSTLFQLSKTMVVIDSTNKKNKLVCYKNDIIVKYYDASCEWLKRYLPLKNVLQEERVTQTAITLNEN